METHQRKLSVLALATSQLHKLFRSLRNSKSLFFAVTQSRGDKGGIRDRKFPRVLFGKVARCRSCVHRCGCCSPFAQIIFEACNTLCTLPLSPKKRYTTMVFMAEYLSLRLHRCSAMWPLRSLIQGLEFRVGSFVQSEFSKMAHPHSQVSFLFLD